MKNTKLRRVLLALYHYASFFLFMSFLITCCMTLFLTTLSSVMGFSFTSENVRLAALVTFANVVFLSLLCTVIDALRRKFTVERPVQRIVQAAERMMQGDFSVRIPPLHSVNRVDGLDRIIACFNRMAQELSGIETLRTDFIANVSHELKTPLAVMQNYSKLLQQPFLPQAKQQEYAQEISAACSRLAALVTNILRLNKLENQKLPGNTAVYDLGEQLCACLLGFETAWEEKHLTIETDIAPDVQVCADAQLLELVWNNLFSNAVKFNAPGGRLTLTLQTQGEFALVQVSDTGCGISPEIGPHIFEKFYQGDTSHTGQGNGLGLALVRRVMDLVDGDITVGSQQGKGSTFTVKIRRVCNEPA